MRLSFECIQSVIEFFSLTSAAAAAAAAIICSQSQAADFQATVAEDFTVHQLKFVEFAHLTTADQKIYTTALTIYKNKLKAYNFQQHKIQQLIEYIQKTVLSVYHKICCNSELFIND